MRLREPTIPDWLAWCIAAPMLVLAIPFVALGFALFAVIWIKRKALGPSEAWTPWFAWYPVRVDYHDTRWLETVERRSFGQLQDTQFRARGSEE